MDKPIIGIAGNIFSMENYKIPGIKRSYVNEDYINAVEKAGGIPLVLPVTEDKDIVRAQVDSCDGIILTGGQDVNPLLYNEDPYKHLGRVNLKVDKYHFEIAKLVIEEDKPTLGICRGLQILNIVQGGTLYQDLSQMEGDIMKHFQEGERYELSHKIDIKAGSILAELWGEKILINSYHHQCIKDVGEGIEVIANASDGAIEAIELKGKKFIVGVQWHPEMMSVEYSEMAAIFDELIRFSKK